MPATIQKHVGDLLAVDRGIIVHGCNAKGVMGSGVALAVRRKYPQAYAAYRKTYLEAGLRIGQIIPVVLTRDSKGPTLILVNAITQEFYGTDRRYVDYDGLARCFEQVAELARAHALRDVHFPLIGCGLAGGDWREVAPRIETALEGLNAHLWVLE